MSIVINAIHSQSRNSLQIDITIDQHLIRFCYVQVNCYYSIRYFMLCWPHYSQYVCKDYSQHLTMVRRPGN